MEKETKRKIGVIALILALIICLYFVASTYSKYTSTIEADSELGVAQWAVKVGGVDATTVNEFTLTLDTTSEYVSDGKIAPETSVTGSFIIDPADAEVAMEYAISTGDVEYASTGTLNGTAPDGITVSSISVEYWNAAESATVTPSGITAYTASNASGIIGLGDVENAIKLKVTVTVTWKTDGDDVDTNYGIEAGTLTIPVTVTASQYVG